MLPTTHGGIVVVVVVVVVVVEVVVEVVEVVLVVEVVGEVTMLIMSWATAELAPSGSVTVYWRIAVPGSPLAVSVTDIEFGATTTDHPVGMLVTVPASAPFSGSCPQSKKLAGTPLLTSTDIASAVGG